MIRVLFFSTLILVSCNEKRQIDSFQEESFFDIIQALGITNEENTHIIILPVDGCAGCDLFVLGELNKMKLSLDLTRIRIILSGIHYRELLNDVSLDDDFILTLDKANLMTRSSVISIYPVIVHVKNKRIHSSWTIKASSKEEDLLIWLNQFKD